MDAARWRRVFDAPIRGFDDLIDEVFQPFVHMPSHPATLARFGIRALMPATWTAGQFKDDPARALFMGVAAHSFSQLTTPLSSSVGLLLTAAAHAVGWPVAEGGTESITRSLPSGKWRVGLQTTPRVMTPSASGQSKTKTLAPTPIWQAAKPTPSAAYIVALMSATSDRSASSYSVTAVAGWCMTGVPHRVMARTVPPLGSGADSGDTLSGGILATGVIVGGCERELRHQMIRRT